MPESHPLPAGFAALEPYVDAWAHATNAARLERRMSSSMDEIEAFYNTMLPLIEAALAHLDRFPLGQLPPAEQTLYHLVLAAGEAAVSVEIYRAPKLPLAPDASRVKVHYANMDGE
jgi:predicted naringenin-chalcone synthase